MVILFVGVVLYYFVEKLGLWLCDWFGICGIVGGEFVVVVG